MEKKNSLNYRIVIPSRKRSNTLKNKTLKLFPTATVLVSEEERDDYAKITDNVETHNLKGIAKIRQYALTHFKEDTIVFLDDDLNAVISLVGHEQRVYKDPADVLRIIENSIVISRDLNLALFTYNRNPNPALFKSSEPIKLTGVFCAGAYGVNKSINPNLKFDTNLKVRGEDIDLSLQSYLYDRVIYSDNRFYFHFGNVSKGSGGLQGIRNQNDETEDVNYLIKKWGKYINPLSINKLAYGRKVQKRSIFGIHINVERKSPLATLK